MATKVECLSSREHQVYALVGHGLCNKEIARELRISDGTVKLHVHRILQKLGMHNRYGIVIAHMLALRPRPRQSTQAETGAAKNRAGTTLTEPADKQALELFAVGWDRAAENREAMLRSEKRTEPNQFTAATVRRSQHSRANPSHKTDTTS